MKKKLAIDGSVPVADEKIPYHRPSISAAEKEAAVRVLDSGFIAGPGPECEEVEERLENRWECERVLTTTSCTHSLEIALLCMDLQPGDEVIVPSFTYVSTALAVVRAGGRPVFADVDETTLTLTAATIEPAYTENTRGVLMVHYGGYPGPVNEVVEFCEKRNLFCLEDAAQTFDGRLNGRQAGTFGQFGALSFHATKSLTSGEGGALLINDPDYIKKAEMIRDKGTDRSVSCRGDADRYTWRSTGSSYVLSDILAGILKEQLNRWPEIRKQRLQIQQETFEMLSRLDREGVFDFVLPRPDGVETNGHITAFILKSVEARDWFLRALQAEGIEALEHYHPLHLTPYARENLEPPESLPVSERIAGSIVRLPAYPGLTTLQRKQIGEALKKIYPHLLEKIG